MPTLVDSLHAEAEAAIAAMRTACEAARTVHARAELARHMLTTARKTLGRPRAEAVAAVVDEWLFAWALSRGDVPGIAAAMDSVTDAFCTMAEAPSPAADGALRAAWDGLEAACAATGASVADRMAWRSMCAHGWWADIRPAPPGEGRADTAWPAAPFWTKGCLPQCL